MVPFQAYKMFYLSLGFEFILVYYHSRRKPDHVFYYRISAILSFSNEKYKILEALWKQYKIKCYD